MLINNDCSMRGGVKSAVSSIQLITCVNHESFGACFFYEVQFYGMLLFCKKKVIMNCLRSY